MCVCVIVVSSSSAVGGLCGRNGDQPRERLKMLGDASGYVLYLLASILQIILSHFALSAFTVKPVWRSQTWLKSNFNFEMYFVVVSAAHSASGRQLA